MGEKWPWFMDMHVHYFSKRTLARLLASEGFTVVGGGARGRFLSLEYLASRVRGLHDGIGRLSGRILKLFHLHRFYVPVNFGDIMTLYAKKPL
jgi:hypothetical protein